MAFLLNSLYSVNVRFSFFNNIFSTSLSWLLEGEVEFNVVYTNRTMVAISASIILLMLFFIKLKISVLQMYPSLFSSNKMKKNTHFALNDKLINLSIKCR